jgi:hypothetical protein
MYAASNLSIATIPLLASILSLALQLPLGVARGQEDRIEAPQRTRRGVDEGNSRRETDEFRDERGRTRSSTRREAPDDAREDMDRDDAKVEIGRTERTRARASTLRRGEFEEGRADETGEPGAVERIDNGVERDSVAFHRGRGDRSAASTGAGSGGLKAPDLGIWFKRGSSDLLIIDALSRDGAIAQFGFLEGDRIVSVNGQRVTKERDFLNVLMSDDVRGQRVPIVVIRDSRRQLVYVRPELLVSDAAAVVDPLDRLGIVLDDRYVDRMIVWRVLPRSPAYYAGIRAGDVITTFDGVEVVDAGDFVRQIEVIDSENVPVGVRRNQRDLELAVDLRITPVVAAEVIPPAVPRNEALDDLRPDPYSDRRLSPRPDVPPGMRVPGGEVGRERGPITPATSGPAPTTPMRTGFPR